MEKNKASSVWTFAYDYAKGEYNDKGSAAMYRKIGIKVMNLYCLEWSDLAKIAKDNNLLLEEWDFSVGNSSPREDMYVLCYILDDKIVAKKTASRKERKKAQERVKEVIKKLRKAGEQLDKLVNDIKSEYRAVI